MLTLKKEEGYTTEYIYTLPEGKRAELIDGVIYDMAPHNFNEVVKVGIYEELEIDFSKME